MATYVHTLTGNQYAFGTAFDKSGTDYFTVYGPGNTIEEDGGNLTVVGTNNNSGLPGHKGFDTQTTILLGGSSATDNPAVKTTINVTLDGSGNSVVDDPYTPSAGFSGYATYKSTINVTVTGKGPQGNSNGQFGFGGGTGNNLVGLDNYLGTTTVKLVGTNNAVYLNGDATNTVVAGSGSDFVAIGGYDDDDFGFTSKVTATGSHNTIYGGDENFTVNGGANSNSIVLGDGTNSVAVTGTNNTITVGGGNNVINAGGSGATVTILGIDSYGETAYVADSDNSAVPSNPNDTVTIAGSGDLVTATYENVTVNGTGVTGTATVTLGDGNDNITLGGTNDLVTAGNGNDNVTLTGANDTVTLGDGNDTVSSSGGSASITLGNGDDTVTAGGINNTITAGNGNDTVTANGNGQVITLGTAGPHQTGHGGNDTIVAGGTGDTVTVFAKANSHDSITIGSHDTVNVTGGIDTIMGAGGLGQGDANDIFYLNNIQAGSTIDVFGNKDMVFLGSNSSAHVVLGGSNTKDTTTVQGNTDNTYTGTVEISNFGPGQTLDLQGLDGANGAALDSLNEVYLNSQSGAGGTTINLAGGGKIVLDSYVSFQNNEFQFTSNTGPVGPAAA